MKRIAIIFCTIALTTTSLYADVSKNEQINEQITVINKLSQEKKFDEALEKVNAILEKEPLNLRAIRLRGNLYFALKKYKESLKDFEEIVRLYPRRAKGYFDRGIVHFAMGNDELAMDDIEKAYALNPELIKNLGSKSNFGKKIHEIREKAHTAKFQVRHKGGMINTKKGGLITKVKR